MYISITVDGGYGDEVVSAVEEFQEANNLNEDGIAGPRTANLLDLEAEHPYSDEEMAQMLEEKGISSEQVSESTKLHYINLVESKDAFADALELSSPAIEMDEVGVIRLKMDTSLTDKIIQVSGQVSGNENLNFYCHIDERTDEIITITVFNAKSFNYDDEVKLRGYNVMDDEINDIDTQWVELDNVLLSSSLAYKAEDSTQTSSVSAFSDGSEYIPGDMEDWSKALVCEAASISSCGILTTALGFAGGIACSAAWAYTTTVLEPDTCDNIYDYIYQ
ncbi:peptidoglycan-binding protein [Halobacillus sp. A1]|uniref:peptidoglycan-binding domain-containing protein n=1 Tax=Halobacillus sp. A1 TaxID=2880262 RepID=UPI0020A6741D|nr:peptidoglycan-binding protein [Halobacillus sp. A1]